MKEKPNHFQWWISLEKFYDILHKFQAENLLLKQENEEFREVLVNIYQRTRTVLGIEAATMKRHEEMEAKKRV